MQTYIKLAAVLAPKSASEMPFPADLRRSTQ